jgi:hypothetical protein
MIVEERPALLVRGGMKPAGSSRPGHVRAEHHEHALGAHPPRAATRRPAASKRGPRHLPGRREAHRAEVNGALCWGFGRRSRTVLARRYGA